MLRNTARPAGLVRALVVMACALGIALVAAPAASATAPTLVGQFNGSDVPGGFAMDSSTHVAVDEASGDVYVTDAAHDAVDRFHADGTFASQITGLSTTAGSFSFGTTEDDLAVDNTGGANQGWLYVASPSSGRVFAFNASGIEQWEIRPDGTTCGVAVDPSGQPWIGDFSVNGLTQLNASDGTPTGATIPAGSEYCHFGFDNEGSVYAANFSTGRGIDKYDNTGAFVYSIESNSLMYQIGTTFQQNTFFAAEADLSPPATPTVRQFDKSGTQLSRLDGSLGSNFAHGVAYNGRTDRIYVSDDTAGQIFIYSVPPQPPTVTAEAPTDITDTSATLHAKVNPNGNDVTDCHAIYETDAEFSGDGGRFTSARTAPCSPAPPISGARDVEVTVSLTGLTPSTTYHTEIVATNSAGTTNGADTLVTTLAPRPRPPITVTGPASGITDTSATLAGTVNPNGFNVTDCHIEYGTDTSYGASVPCSPSPGSGSSAVAVSGAVTGLTSGLHSGTPYHYRVVATNAGGTTPGADATFTTRPICDVNPAATGCAPPPLRCPQDPTQCHPHLHLNGGGSWVGSNWFLRVKCSDDLGGTCAGTLTLKATIKVKVKKGHKTVVKKKTITVGTASYNLAVGGTARLKVKLTSAAKSALKKGGLTATVTSSVDGKLGTVKIAKIKAKHKHKHKRK